MSSVIAFNINTINKDTLTFFNIKYCYDSTILRIYLYIWNNINKSKTFFKGYEIVSFKTAGGDASLEETASLHRNSA